MIITSILVFFDTRSNAYTFRLVLTLNFVTSRKDINLKARFPFFEATA